MRSLHWDHDLPATFWAKVDKSAPRGCWLWTASLNSAGYGRIRIDTTLYYAHRLSLAASGVAIPEGREVDHVCHVRACVNPAHLRLVTPGQNNQNHSGAQSNSRSGLRGVSWSTRNQCWLVQVKKHGKVQVSRYFSDIGEANAFAIATRNRLFTHNEVDRAS